jgi:CDP-diacylglycerol--serine O-phosphatidyltransferase
MMQSPGNPVPSDQVAAPAGPGTPRSLWAILELPDYVTFLGSVAGLLATGLAFRGVLWLAAALLLVAVLCDRFDGKLARWLDRKHKVFGAELDNLNDCLCFGVACAAFGYGLGLTSPLAVMILILFCLAAIARLARFAFLKLEGNYYSGMPTTYNGVIFPALYGLARGLDLPPHISHALYLTAFLVTAFLMTSDIRWRKI